MVPDCNGLTLAVRAKTPPLESDSTQTRGRYRQVTLFDLGLARVAGAKLAVMRIATLSDFEITN